MLRDEAVDLLMKRLGRQKDLTLRDDIILEMVTVQANILEGDTFNPWFLVSEEATSATITGDERVLLPADFIALWQYGTLHRYDAALADPYIEMVRDDWDEISIALNYSDVPTHWDLAGPYFLMRPLADDVYPLKFYYIRRGLDLSGIYGDTNNVQNVWLEHAVDWFLGEVGMIIAEQHLQFKPDRVKRFESQAARGRTRVMFKNIAMEEALKCRIMGG